LIDTKALNINLILESGLVWQIRKGIRLWVRNGG